ncbi:MAG: glycosyltransferase family 87 protein [Gemmataceae bacterium]
MADATPASTLPANAQPPRWPRLVAALLFFAIAFSRSLGTPDDYPRDFFIHRLGSQLVIRGENPYDIPKIRQHIADAFPLDDGETLFQNTVPLVTGDFAAWLLPADQLIRTSFPMNCGYFMPPMTLVVYAPFAVLPWVPAMILWAIVNGVAAYVVTRLPSLVLTPGESTPWLLAVLAPFLMLMNPTAPVIVFPDGQTSMVSLGFVVAGLLAYERGRFSLMAVLWVFPFVKPHLALPLIPLLWFLGGWRPALLLIGLVGLLNAIGATIVGGSPLFLKEYIDFLPQAREVVLGNRVEMNNRLSSWNRLLYAHGGPLIELGFVTTVAGYLVWYSLLIGRWALDGERPSAAWAVAATGAGAVLCSQVIGYEFVIVLMALPWVRDLFLSGDRIRGSLGFLFLFCVCINYLDWVGASGPHVREHNSLAIALFALMVLTGPTRLRPPTPAVASA